MRNNLLFALCVVAILCVYGCTGTNDQSLENPITSGNQSATVAAAGTKTNVCHFDAKGSRVIVVSDTSLLPAHFSHGDCTTTEPKGTKDCGCGSATINIIKDAFPNTETSFSFSAGGQVNQGFSLTDNGVVGPDRITFSGLTGFGAGNEVIITETDPDPYDLTSLSCSNIGGGSHQINLPGRTVTITLVDQAIVTCTFVNSLPAN